MIQVQVRTMGIDELVKDLKATRTYLQDAMPLFNDLVRPIRNKFGEIIDTQGSGKWPKLRQSTIDQRMWHTSYYKRRGRGGAPGYVTGALHRSFIGGRNSVLRIGPHMMKIGSRDKKAKVFDQGSKNRYRPAVRPTRAQWLRWASPEHTRGNAPKSGRGLRRTRSGWPYVFAKSARAARNPQQPRTIVDANDHLDTVEEKAWDWVMKSPLFNPSRVVAPTGKWYGPVYRMAT